jgi:hypothetical protein
MSNNGNVLSAASRSLAARASPPGRLVDDNLRDENAETSEACVPPIACRCLMPRHNHITARASGIVAWNGCFEIHRGLHLDPMLVFVVCGGNPVMTPRVSAGTARLCRGSVSARRSSFSSEISSATQGAHAVATIAPCSFAPAGSTR